LYRKSITAIIAGFLALLLSPFSFSITIGEIIISMPWTIVIPILISMAYGAKFGFIAGISGSAFYPFLLWPNNGYPNVMNTVILLLLFTTLGIAKNNNPEVKYSLILKNIFLILAFNVAVVWILYHTLFIQLLSLNPAFWEPYAIKHIDPRLLTSFAIKDTINFVLLTCFAEMLLRIPLIRYLFGLKISPNMKFNNVIFVISFVISVLIGSIILVLDYALLDNDRMNHKLLELTFLVIVWSGMIVARIIMVFSEKRIENEGELKKVNNQIKEDQEKLNSLINALPDLIFIFSKDYKFIDFFSNNQNNLFAPPKEFLGKKIFEILPPEIAVNSQKCIDKLFSSGELQNFNYSINIGNEKKYFEARFVLKGKDTCLSIVSDITEQKRAEIERKVLYEITSGIATANNLVELIRLIHKSIGEIIYAENFFVALYEPEKEFFSYPYFVDKFDPIPEPEPIGKSCAAWVIKHGKSLLLTEQIFTELLENHEVDLVGSSSPSWVGVPLKINEKTIGVLVLQHYEDENIYTEYDLHFLSSVANQIAIIIERKRADEELIESESRFRAIFEQTSVGTALINSVTGKFVRINQKFCDFAGYNEEEMLHKSLNDITYSEDQNKTNFSDKQFFEKNSEEYSSVKRYVHKNGNIIWGNLTISPLLKSEENKEMFYNIAIMEDITERKNSELIIKEQNKQLKELNFSRDKLFSIIAHDLRSPFHGFLAMTQLLSDSLDEFSIEETKVIAQQMNNSAQNFYKLLHELLEWAQVQNINLNYTPDNFLLIEILDESIATIRERASQKEIDIINQIPGNLMVYADRKMISTVFRNLLSNAIKFTKSGGEVSISSKFLKNDLIEVSISDNGIGISLDDQKKIFKLDGSLRTEGTDGEQSTGLGLLLCMEFIEKNGGSIRVESEEGKGSIFYFTIHSKKWD
jgi:PAS domain S-box-containing protein